MNVEKRNRMYDVVSEITAERERQIDLHQWTAEHDDNHPLQAWGWLLARRAVDLTAPGEPLIDARRCFVEIAAIAVAAIESLDRRRLASAPIVYDGDDQGEHVTCGDCGETTLGPDDHKCPNEDCPSHNEAACPADPQGQHYVGCGCDL